MSSVEIILLKKIVKSLEGIENELKERGKKR
jgi:hypothetical protein